MNSPESTQTERAGPGMERNRLARSTSPYLRQHATNPVEWYEWGEEALSRARRENRPILLSVGYSACHWCHVMAHESFEDPETAAEMNARFINIKVDREERPDIDAIYQKVVLLMGEGGGWPLTVFLTPGGEPFYGGTYFPPQPSHGRPGFRQLLGALSEAFANRSQQVEDQVVAFREGLQRLAAVADEEVGPGGAPWWTGADPYGEASRRLASRFDAVHGGFGQAPKFPNPTALELLLRHHRSGAPGATAAGDNLRVTLDHMRRGGIYDQLRGGFARYSVDREWLVPHFEKMLYDNAQLLPLFAEAAVLWPEAGFERVVGETLDYLESDMRSPQGLFYASTDADSEGEEGRYFVWTPDQVRALLGDRELSRLFCAVYDVTERGNFEGRNILNRPRTLAEEAEVRGLDVDQLEDTLRPARARLLRARYERVAPHRDDKIVTAWNALLASGLCRVAGASDGPDAGRAARLARGVVDALLQTHVDEGGRVFRASFEGRAHTRGVVDDVAFLARACLDLHELDLDPERLEAAHTLADHALRQYRRPGGGFHLAAADGESLIERTESLHDSAIPSGMGVMVEVLLRLDAAGRSPKGGREAAMETLARFPTAPAHAFAHASLVAGGAHSQGVHVTLRGPTPGDAQVLAEIVRRHRVAEDAGPRPVSLSFQPHDGDCQAIVCQGSVCSAPLTDGDGLREALGNRVGPG